MTDTEALMILNALPKIGPRRMQMILESIDAPGDVFCKPNNILQKCAFLPSPIIDTIKNWQEYFDLAADIRLCEKNNVSVVTVKQKEYPANLRHINDPPPVLYVKGILKESDKNSVAIVGSRRASLYGLRSAEKLAYQLSSRGIVVVSGMARGIDSMAHKGAVAAGGRTIAVLGSGLTVIYPPENRKLFEEIISTGAVISEFSMKTPPVPGNFPRRNRIISGLSLGVLIVEAAKKSGSLITAQLALDYGRTVFALPGRIDSALSKGVNELLKDGACLVSDIEDIITEIPELQIMDSQKNETIHKRQDQTTLNDVEKELVHVVSREPQCVDAIVTAASMSSDQVLQGLLTLELKGLVKQLPGKQYVSR